jgi:uncharacterized protein (DUF1501 family)
MNRRQFLSLSGVAASFAWLPAAHAADALGSPAQRGSYRDLLILIELKGGNDGLNTVIPYADPLYYQLRPKIGIARDKVVQLDERTALHPSLDELMPLWRDGSLAIVQGVSYPQPNLSHFRSIEIWDTASRSDEYLREGWLTRAFAAQPVPAGFAADGAVIGSAEMGPFANGARVIALVNPAQFVRDSRLAMPVTVAERNPSLKHILDVEHDIVQAAERLRPRDGQFKFATPFPGNAFGAAVRTAMQVAAAGDTAQGKPIVGQGVAAMRLTLNGFDTHQNQPAQQANLLKQFAQGMIALRSALTELGRWDSTLVMTYAEFGRRVRENQGSGTDHGTVAPHFIAGGRVRGGLYGVAPQLAKLDGNGNLPLGVDFRSMYATVLERWWGVDSMRVLNGRFETLPVLRA